MAWTWWICIIWLSIALYIYTSHDIPIISPWFSRHTSTALSFRLFTQQQLGVALLLSLLGFASQIAQIKGMQQARSARLCSPFWAIDVSLWVSLEQFWQFFDSCGTVSVFLRLLGDQGRFISEILGDFLGKQGPSSGRRHDQIECCWSFGRCKRSVFFRAWMMTFKCGLLFSHFWWVSRSQGSVYRGITGSFLVVFLRLRKSKEFPHIHGSSIYNSVNPTHYAVKSVKWHGLPRQE